MDFKKIAFTTLGCKVNLYDTEAMIELFEDKGYKIVDFTDYADIYVINTCTVTNFGSKKSRQMIRRAKELNQDAIIVATGCYSQVAPDEVAKIYGINIIMGTKNRLKVVEIVENYIENNKKEILNIVTDIMEERTFEPLSISTLKNRTRAFLKIQEGCDKFCTYCIIPYARGPVRSREPQHILEEVKRLAQNGFKEVVLTGIHILAYGKDLKNINLLDIIKRIHTIEGIKRIRFSSIEPLVITDEFIEEIKKLPKVCNHYHLSLQSGCDKTLSEMKRSYTSNEYKIAVDKLRIAFKDVAITTDIITGFPNESEHDFLESYNFVKNLKITDVHSFPYSPKKGTKASLFDGQITNEIKLIRNKKMIELANNLNIEFLENMIGKVFPVLFEKKNGDNKFEGHTTNYSKVIVDSSNDISNKILDVSIKSIYSKNYLIGEIV